MGRHGRVRALCDPNPRRAEVVRQIIGVDCPVFTDFDRMVKEARPDLVAITTVDAFHAEYIVRALDLGLDVITEKPMTIDEKQTQAVSTPRSATGGRSSSATTCASRPRT